MDSNEIFKKIIECGVDEGEIRDRFCNEIDLYVQCFHEFLKEPNLTVLQNAITSKEYAKAYEAAHTIKGISGNLGLNDIYNSISILVKSLRIKQYQFVDEEYKNFMTKCNYIFSKF